MSDLHCGSGEAFLQEKLGLAVEEINDLNPEIVIVAGDLTENGFKNEFEEAKRFIDQIKCKKIITSGNHDAKFTGYLLFENIFGSPSGTFEDDKYVIFYANTARPDKDEGRVGKDQAESLLQAFRGTRKFKILVLHHHLIPVPDTGLEQAIVEDAGDVLKIISNVGVNLVLCGHRHRPWRWMLNGMDFIFTGAVSTRRLRGFFENSYNIIEVKDGRVNPKLKIVGGPLIDFTKIVS
jgi:3',5'-cyclic AMP phosphodiesterase CpdA